MLRNKFFPPVLSDTEGWETTGKTGMTALNVVKYLVKFIKNYENISKELYRRN